MRCMTSGLHATAVLLSILVSGSLAAESETEPPPAPRSEEADRVAEPGMGQREKFRERMRVLRETGGDGDFSGFENEAAEEAAKRRDQAIRREAESANDELDALEEEMLQDSLNEQGLWGGTGCFARPPDLSHQQDLALYKDLTKDDFLEKRPDRTRTPGKEATKLHADVYVVISCALNTIVDRPREDHFVARARRASYFPMISRSRSWWNPASKKPAPEVLAHAQLHLELARMLSEELTAKFEQGLVAVRGEGRSEEAALARFQQRWGKHIQEARDELHRLGRAYDRETGFGSIGGRQAAWARRFGDGLPAVRAGAVPTAN